MTDRSPGDVYLAKGIDQWIRAPSKTSEDRLAVNEFHVFAMHHRPSDRLSLTDVSVLMPPTGP